MSNIPQIAHLVADQVIQPEHDRATLENDLRDWLASGDGDYAEQDVPDLASEWNANFDYIQ